MARASSSLKGWLTLTGIAYAVGAIGFVLRPRDAVETLNASGGEPVDHEGPPGLYNSLAGAYMATIAALALTAAGDPDERKALIPPLMVAKAASSSALLYRYAQTKKRGFAVGAAIDATILGITAGLYSAVTSSRD
jgi:hypothetical protein